MTKIKDNIEELRKILNEDNFKKDEAIEFLDAIESDADELQDELDTTTDDLKDKDSEIDNLKDEVNSMENSETTNQIDCGIGTIDYDTPNNLVLQDIMENLGELIKKHNPKKVNEILTALV